MSHLCRPASFGLAILAPSRGVESPVPTGVHTLAWTAAGCDGVQENPKFVFEVGFDTTALHICVTIEPDKNKFM